MPLATRFLSYALLALLVVQGQLHGVRADDGGDGQDYGGNGADGDHGDAQAAGWAPHPPPPPPGNGGPPPPPGGPPPPPGPPGGPPQPGPPGWNHGGWPHPGGWPPRPDTQVLWGQCGGYYYYGTTRCPPGAYCRWFSDWYSQCNPNGH